MARDYSAIADTAKRLVTDAGRAVTFVRLGSTPADASKPWRSAADPRGTPEAELELTAVFVNPWSTKDLGFGSISEDLMKRSKQVLVLAPGSAEQTPLNTFHTVLDTDGVEWKIEGVETLKPAGVALLYYVGVSR
jgi:hypothetical protein